MIERFRNPFNNKDLKNFEVRTFDDVAEVYEIDILEYTPLTKCDYPCQSCTSDKDFCTKCWTQFDDLFLMTKSGTDSTCKSKCDDGWSTNGNPEKQCSTCKASCKTCQDNGNVGDAGQCIECAAGFDLKFGNECFSSCPQGTFQVGN